MNKVFIFAALFLVGCGPNQRHRKMKGEFLRKQGTQGVFVTQDDKDSDIWWYYTWNSDAGTPTTYEKGVTILPEGGSWFKGTQPPKEDIIEEEEEEATIDSDNPASEEVGAEDTGADASESGAEAGDAADAGGDGEE